MIFGFTPPGGAELLVILAIVLLFFGGAKLPGLARSLGQAQREFRKGSQESLDDGEPAKDDKPAT